MNMIVILCDTLRRDHCGPYHQGRPLNEAGGADQPSWVVPTPNLDRLAAKGTVFDNCYNGSTPCMPARRDMYTGSYEFLRRGWGPLEEDDPDLPRQLSPVIQKSLHSFGPDDHVSYLVTDHHCLWINGAGNYHMGYTGFDFIRGNQEDPWTTGHVNFPFPEADRNTKLERYFRNKYFFGDREEDSCVARLFNRASDWLRHNHLHEDFYLHIDSYTPHEPWVPPLQLLERFDPKGYDIEGWSAHPPYVPWQKWMTEAQFDSYRARYAATVVLMDRWLGKFFDTMDELALWDNTMLIFMTDHGTLNGDHGRIGKGQTHEFGGKSHTPFIVHHPEWGHGERRNQLVQNVDVYTTVLEAFNKPIPDNRDGVSLLPVLRHSEARTRDYAIMGEFGQSIAITDGEWTWHQAPDPDKPLYSYSHHTRRDAPVIKFGPYRGNRRKLLTNLTSRDNAVLTSWLTNRKDDPAELDNVAEMYPEKAAEMKQALRQKLGECHAPQELNDRFQLTD